MTEIYIYAHLTRIKKPVAKEMADFEAYFDKTMRSEIPLLNIILNYISSPERETDEAIAGFSDSQVKRKSINICRSHIYRTSSYSLNST